MDTIVKKIEDMNSIDNKVIDVAANILRNGGLVAIPTETVYGLAGDALSKEAAKKIYGAKGRPSDNPLIVHIAKVEDLYNIASTVPDKAVKLAEKFWPGPLTMVLKKGDYVPDGTTGGLDTVAVRMPNNKIALKIIEESGVYLAAPSANTSGRPSPTKAKHVIDDLYGKIDMIVDGGTVGIGIESTIIDLTSDIPTILRPGYITKAMLESIIGEVQIDKAILAENKDKGFVPKAPGMKYKHYAPKADMLIVLGEVKSVVDKINSFADNCIKEGKKVGIIATEETKDMYNESCDIKVIGARTSEETVASGLYNVLREFDESNVEYIYSEGFVDDELGQAIMNRLLKAAGYNVLELEDK